MPGNLLNVFLQFVESGYLDYPCFIDNETETKSPSKLVLGPGFGPRSSLVPKS